jgi:hypothetical protein
MATGVGWVRQTQVYVSRPLLLGDGSFGCSIVARWKPALPFYSFQLSVFSFDHLRLTDN